MTSRQRLPLALILWALGCGSGTSLPQDGSSGAIDSAAGGTGGTAMGTGGGTGGAPMGTGGSGGSGGTCGPVCAIYCPNGNVLDSRGCPTCGCKPPPDAGDTGSVTLKDDACGTQVQVKVGTEVAVSLASTYWTIAGSSSPAVLRESGPMTYGKGQNCPTFPGSGCGTANMTFAAVSAGQATISASRVSCGEALRCGHGQGQDQCTITVVVVP